MNSTSKPDAKFSRDSSSPKSGRSYRVHYDRDGSVYYTNTSILYVKSGVASNEQLAAAMKKALDEVSRRLGRPVPCQYKTNLIIGRNGLYYGFGYLCVTNPEVYHMLLGKKPDGSENIELIDDPNWVEPEENMDDVLARMESTGNWADDSAAEDYIVQSYQKPKLKRFLSPLMVLPGYSYTEEDLKRTITNRKESTNRVPEDLHIPEDLKEIQGLENGVLGNFYFLPAFVRDPDPKYCPNVLCTRDTPEWVTETMLKREFTPFASDNRTKIQRKIKGIFIEDTYPFVTINDKRVSFITFDPETKDAAFAILMTKRIILVGPRRDQNCVLIFNHSYRSTPRSSSSPSESKE